jgi:outer membrane protein assembly factor BamB
MRKSLEVIGLVSLTALAFSVAGCSARATDPPAGKPTVAAAATPSPSNAALPQPAAAAEQSAAAAGEAGNASQAGAAPSVETGSAASAETGAWPQWRGPNRDGRVAGFRAPRVWPKTLKEEWKITVGVGHASPVVADGRAYVFARQGEEEVLLCLDAATGKELWRSAHGVAYEMNSAARGHGKGPKSTPVVSGGRVFTLGITGVLSAHDARTGKLAWRKDFSREYPATSPLYGTAMSPVVERNLLIAHVGGQDKGALTAFDTATGAVRWAYAADGPAYSSPIVATLGGERQVVTFTQKELVGVSTATGKLLWKLPAKTYYDTNSMTAVAYKDMIIFSLEEKGLVAVRPVRQGETFVAREVWRNTENELYMNSPVIEGGRLYGLSVRRKGQLFCVEADTGQTVWQGPGRMGENAAILNLSGTLLVLNDDASLIFLPADAKDYAPAARYTVASSPTWAHPAVVGRRLLVKDETTLASLAISGD